jgi:hypothetical protein
MHHINVLFCSFHFFVWIVMFNKKIVFQNSLFCGQLSQESEPKKFKLHYSKPKITKCAKIMQGHTQNTSILQCWTLYTNNKMPNFFGVK